MALARVAAKVLNRLGSHDFRVKQALSKSLFLMADNSEGSTHPYSTIPHD